ncbi:VOC family protein [Achromobacter sp. AGC39]
MNHRIVGIDQITYSADDLDACRAFFLDWGLTLHEASPSRLIFHTLNGCQVAVYAPSENLPPAIEPGPTLREVVWGVSSDAMLITMADRLRDKPGYCTGCDGVSCLDPNGLTIRFERTRRQPVVLECGAMNTWAAKPRVNQASPIYERATPIEIGHVVFFVKDVEATARFYTEFCGFVMSDCYPGRGVFLRCDASGGHHDLFLLQLPQARAGLNHVAFTVRDIHEVFGGGLHMARCGWETQLGPGRHPVSSAYFWYFKNPAGGLIEYYADEDQLDERWQPREFEPGPTVFAEWAIDGGIDGNTRRQKSLDAARPGLFPTDQSAVKP